eukprot:TRINITY_DN10057_c0_g1_i2.p1 TRINITY_DN10057_c0_g1~~TRINITY_DN10057_c0_g1_i2.p1  ORF type:complete len:307 (-),score=84.69 TRINITY_DN10057_c0_g1_i2:22-942(-)
MAEQFKFPILKNNILAAPRDGPPTTPLKAILAGGIAGGIEICITYPTEYTKTIMQLYEKESLKGPIQVVKDTVKTNGITGIYRGLTCLLYFSIPKSAVRFLGFETAKGFLQGEGGKMTTTANLTAGLVAGVIEAITVVTPMETIKVKLIHDQLSPNPRYRGFFHGVTSIAKEQGLAGCYKGLVPTILKQGSNQMIRFAVFYELKRQMLGEDPSKKFSVPQSMFAGAVAGGASVFGNTPIDVVKTRMQGLDAHKYSGSWDCCKQILKNEGIKGFYKGTTPRLGRVCLDVAITMTLYTQIMQLLDKLW